MRVASEQEVMQTIRRLLARLENIDPSYRAMLPSRRTIEAECPDLGLVYHGQWRNGKMQELEEGPAIGRPDIRIAVDSDDLLKMVEGDLDFTRAYSSNRVRIEAGMTDLLRLRAVL